MSAALNPDPLCIRCDEAPVPAEGHYCRECLADAAEQDRAAIREDF